MTRLVLIENFRAVFYAPFYAACTLGAYEAEGLQVAVRVAATPGNALLAVSAGEGEVSCGGPLRVMAALDRPGFRLHLFLRGGGARSVLSRRAYLESGLHAGATAEVDACGRHRSADSVDLLAARHAPGGC